jgi:hypothetical protein
MRRINVYFPFLVAMVFVLYPLESGMEQIMNIMIKKKYWDALLVGPQGLLARDHACYKIESIHTGTWMY